jgi:predicted RNase H-like HicB family nuclease
VLQQLAIRQGISHTPSVNNLLKYRRMALKKAEIVNLGTDEGYAAKIPGFAGLLAVGSSKKAAVTELESALDDWMSLALKRGLGLPALTAPQKARARVMVSA